ncbi:MAG: FRG domain-containing protein [Euryhalocaulis sp.]|uniref:FRG domain-containing protein n=1 Tax=Euryhalocaulis sp. TaxID=2744307 RepID=UPI0017FA65A7|nr:FRG domain-containing protein [Euryhalocaulis sp.]MBA4802526.1 FRG domain-containing protein [Euryhalocaulis sp.]
MPRRINLSKQVLERVRARREAFAHFQYFVDWVQEHKSPRWVFRGQSQKWALLPSVGRLDQYKPEREIHLLEEFKRSALANLDRRDFHSDWDWLSLAQHHGLPTRLIDWTTNPLVAGYFACQPSPRGKRDGLVIAVEARAIGFYRPNDPEEVDPFKIEDNRFLYPSALAQRITAQRGLFSIHANPKKRWIMKNHIKRFEIPGKLKTDFQRMFFSMGIDAACLMTDLDGLAQTLRWRLKNGVLTE